MVAAKQQYERPGPTNYGSKLLTVVTDRKINLIKCLPYISCLDQSGFDFLDDSPSFFHCLSNEIFLLSSPSIGSAQNIHKQKLLLHLLLFRQKSKHLGFTSLTLLYVPVNLTMWSKLASRLHFTATHHCVK